MYETVEVLGDQLGRALLPPLRPTALEELLRIAEEETEGGVYVWYEGAE